MDRGTHFIFSDSTPEEFYEEEKMVFAELKEGEACDYIYAMVTSLADYTYLWRPNIKRRAIKHLEEFVGERIEIKRDLVEEMSEFTEKYKNLIT